MMTINWLIPGYMDNLFASYNSVNVATANDGTVKFGVKTGWICPKCNRVWSPDVLECWICNDQISLENNETTGNN